MLGVLTAATNVDLFFGAADGKKTAFRTQKNEGKPTNN